MYNICIDGLLFEWDENKDKSFDSGSLYQKEGFRYKNYFFEKSNHTGN